MKIFGGTNAINANWELEYKGISDCIDELIGFEGESRGWERTPVNMMLSNLEKTEILEDDSGKIIQKKGDGTVELIKKGERHFFPYIRMAC